MTTGLIEELDPAGDTLRYLFLIFQEPIKQVFIKQDQGVSQNLENFQIGLKPTILQLHT